MSSRSQSAVTIVTPSSVPSRVLTDVIDLSEPHTLSDAWEELFRSAGRNRSTSFEWTSALLRHFVKPGDRTFLVRAWRGEQLIALLPLLARPSTVFRRKVVTLSPLSEQCGTHSDMLIRDLDDSTVDALIDRLFKLDLQWECFRMAKLSEHNPLVCALERSLLRRGATYDLHDDVPEVLRAAPCVTPAVSGRAQRQISELSPSVWKRLARRGQVGVVEIADARDFPAAWEEILRIERTSWNNHTGARFPTPWAATLLSRRVAGRSRARDNCTCIS